MHKKIFTSQFQARFWQKVNKTDYCWEWQGAKINGYGYMWVIRNKLSYYSPRISYALTYGEFNQALCVCHKCDNPPCVNQRIYFLEQELKITTIKRKKADNNHMLELKTQTQSLLFWTLRTFVKCLVLVRHRLQLLKHSMFHKYTLAVSVKAGAGLTKVEV
jgi:hypothetical protein